MTKWFAWFQAGEGIEPTMRVMCAKDITKAEEIANDLAYRDKVELVGVIVASEQFNPIK